VLTVVTGPPCSGKSTHVQAHARPGDIVIDFDRIAQALGSPAPHDHPNQVRWVAIAARKAAITAAIQQHRAGATVWIVHTSIPRQEMTRYLAAGAEVVTLEVDAAELHRRADAERPALWHKLIDEWKPSTQGGSTSRPPTRVRPLVSLERHGQPGLSGRPWKRARARVLADSDVCWWCGHGGADAVDHVVPRSLGGPVLDPANLRPIHGVTGCPACKVKCNSVRGNRLQPRVGHARSSRRW
jgi:5-methylcytosine-specific restriction endonuclease McrA